MEATKKLSPLFMNLFGVGDFGFTLMTMVEALLWMMFLTNALMIPFERVSFIAGVTAFFDVIWVVLSGVIVQSANFKWGKYRSWLIIAPPLVFVTELFMYWPFSGNGGLAETLIIVGFVASHLFFNLSYTAHLTMVQAYTDDISERAILSSRKVMWGNAANIVNSLAVIPLVGLFGGFSQASAFFYTIIAVLSVMIIGYMVLFYLTRPYESDSRTAKAGELPGDNAPAGPPPESMADAVKVTLTNLPFIILMLAQVGTGVAGFMLMSTISYYFQSVFGDAGLMSTYLLTVAVIGIVGAYLSPIISKRLGKKNTYCYAALLYGSVLLVIRVFASDSLPLFLAIIGFGALLGSISRGLGFALFADCITYNVWRTGKSGAGFLMGMASLPIKVAVMIRGIITPLLFKSFNVTIVDGVTASDPTTIAGLKTIALVIPGVLWMIFITVILLAYRLTDKKVAEMNADIAAGTAPGFAT